jgi:hypothetical protein
MAYIGREPLGGEVILLNSIESQFNGSLTTFNLTRTVSGVTSAFYPIGSEQLLVSLGGVIQKPDTTGDTGFRISFNTIIFAVAPVAGTTCFIVAYGNVTDIGAPANNTVTTDKLVDGSVTPAKLSTGGPWWLSNGNVGIGTTNPTQKLHVHSGGILVKGAVTPNINFDPAGVLGNADISYDGNTFNLVSNSNSAILTLGTSSTPRLTILSSGNVGIGTTNPSENLHVHAPGNDLAAIVLSGTATLQMPYRLMQGITGVSNAGFSIYDITAATTRFAIDSAGNIGIGTGNPASILHVEAATPGVTLNTTTNNGTTSITFNEAGANAARLSVSGDYLDSIIELENYSALWASTGLVVRGNNVGIGITTPQNVLDLGSATNNRGISWGGTGANYANIWTEYSTASLHLGQGVRPIGTSTGWVSSTGISSVGRAVIKLNFNTGDIGFHTATPTTVADGSAITVDQRMIISGSGNVGIGTASPGSTLEVRKGGTNTVSGALFGGGFTQTIVSGESQLCLISNIDSSGNFGSTEVARGGIGFSWANVNDRTRFIVGTQSNHALRFFTNNSERVRISESGNVGIGTTDPRSKLIIFGSDWNNTFGGDVVVSNSNTIGSSITLRPTNSTSFSNGWSLYAGASGAAIGDGSVGFWNHTTQKDPVRIDQSDNLHIRYANLVFGTSGKGIDFSANPNASGMTSELLNDYEEGTWTPVWESTGALPTLSYMTQSGYYVKIGRVVHFWGRIYMNSWGGGGGSGNIRVGGLPFTSNSDSNHGGPLCQVTFSYGGGSNAVWPSGASQVFARVLSGSTSIEYISLGVPTTQLGESAPLQWTSNPQMYNNYFSGSYFV